VRNEDGPQQCGPRQAEKRHYEPPRITAYEVPSLLDMIGPAEACIRWSMVGSPENPDGPPEEDG